MHTENLNLISLVKYFIQGRININYILFLKMLTVVVLNYIWTFFSEIINKNSFLLYIKFKSDSYLIMYLTRVGDPCTGK